MKGNCRTVTLLMDEMKRINGSTTKKAVGRAKRLNVASLNSHLICVLCSGYYVEATAIVECLHTFCRSCIVKYLQSNGFCPICDVQIQQSKPWLSLRSDKILQDLVYKLVPGLYQNEMRRRRQFYAQVGRKPENVPGEEGGFPPQGARFFAHEDSISLSLEYYNGSDEENEGVEKLGAEKPKRYLQCPAAVTVRHLKKFLRMKYGIGLDSWVDIIYNDECLPDDFTLIDVAYTFAWKRASPMRFCYRIYSKTSVKARKSPRNFHSPRLDDEEKRKPKRQSSLEQQRQNEYLGNFNLNPTNSTIYKNQNYNKSKSHGLFTTSTTTTTTGTNNNNHSVKNHNAPAEKKALKAEEFLFGALKEPMFSSSDESSGSVLQIISEKESDEDSLDSVPLRGLMRKRTECSPVQFGKATKKAGIDVFTGKKSPRSKQHKVEGKREKRKSEEVRRKSEGADEERKSSEGKRRKSLADEYSLKREMGTGFLMKHDEGGPVGNLKSEALRKVFIAKDKPDPVNCAASDNNDHVDDNNAKKKDEVLKRKKRKKSKHHEGEAKKRKTEVVASSPSIMSVAKDALKFKFKLTPSKPPVKDAGGGSEEDNVKEKKKETKKEETVQEECGGGVAESEAKKSDDAEVKKAASDKERLLHLRAVRHKPVVSTKSTPKDYLNTPPSLTISKIDSSETLPVKSSLVESRPSLEIMLVSPTDATKPKKLDLKSETGKESDSPRGESSTAKDDRSRGSDVLDNFGVLDLSEKSTRTKESGSNSCSPKEIMTETVERCRKSTHQSILQIAQTLVNRKLAPMMADKALMRAGFDGAGESTAAAAMRNLKTLSDTAVNILMAAQSKGFGSCAPDLSKRPFSSISIPPSVTPPLKSITQCHSTKSPKDCENGGGLKIPIFPTARDRANPIPPVPNLHEIYPRGRGRPVPVSRPATPAIKPGQNQTVRQIPNPFVVLNRQTNQSAAKALPAAPAEAPAHTDNADAGKPPKQKTNSMLHPAPLLQSTKPAAPTVKVDSAPETKTNTNGFTDGKVSMPKITNNNAQMPPKNTSETTLFGLKSNNNNHNTNNNNLDDRKVGLKLNNNNNSIRKMENMAKNIESVAAGLTARAVSNAMIDAK